MAMTNAGKALTALAVGVGGYFALSGSAKAKPSRPAYRKQIPIVPNGVAWSTVDEAVCQCYQAGERESVDLVSCVLERLWPDVPWPHQPGDHRSVLRVWQAVGHRVSQFLALPEDERAAACVEVPGVIEDPPPPPPADVKIEDFFGDGPQRFATITQTMNHNPDATARNAWSLPIGDANIPRVIIANANCGFNLLFYSRKRNNGTYGSVQVLTANGDRQAYDIGPAWFPWNNRVMTAAVTGQKLKRQVGWSGNGPAAGGDRAFGSPWKVPMVRTPAGILVQVNADPWAPENNPPAEALALLGWTLDEMRTAWLAGNP